MAFQSFGRSHGPSSAPSNAETPFGHFPRAPSATLTFSHAHPQRSPRPTESPVKWGEGQNSHLKEHNAGIYQRPSVVSPPGASPNFGTGIQGNIPLFQDLKRIRSPPFLDTGENVSSSIQSVNGRHSLSSPTRDNWQKVPRNHADFMTHQDLPSVSHNLDSHDSEQNSTTGFLGMHSTKQTKSPKLLSEKEAFQDNLSLKQNESRRPSLSPHSLGSGSNSAFSNSDFQIHQSSSLSLHNSEAEASATKSAGTKPSSFSVPKRSRSPPSPHANQVLLGNYSTEDDTERELQAKAKRLARFRGELGQTLPSSTDAANQKLSANKYDRSTAEGHIFVGKHSVVAAGDLLNGKPISDHENMESSSIIVGSCPDMCPELERGERERKGDLDQYERVDGDRNQTSEFLAIKKYTRTAEREAHLIRPMPILQKTIDYLLSLLDQPYDDKFLGIYNFLWDRMRAIRMDLRMQHIFNLGAITMLEQMIRLHIIAMHELCEFTKGEGFSEGFDAHLNIEQMNKTSVELFQMYDDHRKNGINVSTEKEFRGYYALLKLDKHPGYKVEPAELSLDLAKMTPEIRQTPEVLFARDVARACRAGNFISFFRYARKASYLQACLMHAHFAKLRTQALASLHSGLQNNQGLPVSHLSNWLAMEQEDVLSLLEYHGFLIKEFKEPYMVKDGHFLNSDKDFPTRCSKLVHLKRSRRIVKDVSSFCEPMPLSTEKGKRFESHSVPSVIKHDFKEDKFLKSESPVHTIDEEMHDLGTVSSSRDGTHLQSIPKASTASQQIGADQQVADVGVVQREFSFSQNSPESVPAEVGSVNKLNNDASLETSPRRDVYSYVEDVPLQISSGGYLPEISPAPQFDSAVKDSVNHREIRTVREMECEEPTHTSRGVESDEDMASYDDEAAKAKLKLIIRIWKRCTSRRRELRKQRELAANAALGLLSMGMPIRKEKAKPSNIGDFDIDLIMRERHQNHERSWSRLNVSEVVVGELSRRNPEAKCLCWKMIICSQVSQKDKVGWQSHVTHLEAAQWLLSKLMPPRKEGDDDDDGDLVISSPVISIWKKWALSQSGVDLTCCLSIVKDTESDASSETVSGANAVLFLISEKLPWELQRINLHNLLQSLPSGSCVPLLILSGSCKGNVSYSSSTIVDELGLHDIDKSRASSFLIVFLVGNQQMGQFSGFFSDERLREGLEWLASQSPSQPLLHRAKTRELVLTHLNSSLKAIDKMSSYEMGPDHCISAFNEALNRSVNEVADAADGSPPGWPCSEMILLKEYSDELRPICSYLPDIGWSSGARIQVLVHALRDCTLPPFPGDISWLARSCGTSKEIENHVSQLESCLARYLTQSCGMMGLALARKEAHVMFQKSTQLKLHDSRYYIVPKWVMIFRRIFNWRLASLSNGDSSAAYVLEPHIVAPTLEDLTMAEAETSVSLPYFMVQPSLDEMVEVGSNPMLYEEGHSKALPETVSVSCDFSEATSARESTDGKVTMDGGELATIGNDSNSSSGLGYSRGELEVAASGTMKDADRLSKLLERCNILQNGIDEKLSIYF